METVTERKPNREERYGVNTLEEMPMEEMPTITVSIKVEGKGEVADKVEEFGELESIVLIGLPKRATVDRSSDAEADKMGLTCRCGAVDEVNGKMLLKAMKRAGDKIMEELTGMPPELLGLPGAFLGDELGKMKKRR